MAIRPFRDIGAKSVQNGIASRKWVMGLFKQVLGGLHFTGDVSQTTDGHVHFEGGGGGAGDSCEFAFRVAITPGSGGASSMSITPGYVRSESSGALYPTFNGVAIGPGRAPDFSIASFTGYRYLTLTIDYTPRVLSSGQIYYFDSAQIIGTPSISITSSPLPAVLPSVDWQTLDVLSSGRLSIVIANLTGSGDGISSSAAIGGNLYLLLTPDLRLIPCAGG